MSKCLKFLFTLIVVTLYVAGKYVPLPGLNYKLLNIPQLISNGGIFRISLFSLGLVPYIFAYLIFIILKAISPKLVSFPSQKMHKFIILTAIFIGAIMGFFRSYWIITFSSFHDLVFLSDLNFILLNTLIMGLATFLVIWICVLISRKGLGAGFSTIILIEILHKILLNIFYSKKTLFHHWSKLILLISCLSVLILITIYILKIELRWHLSQLKKVILPIALPGILPWYFSYWMWMFPLVLTNLIVSSPLTSLINHIYQNPVINNFLFSLLVFMFTFFYTALIFNLNYVKGKGGFNKLEIKRIEKFLGRICLFWAFYLTGFHFLCKFVFIYLKLPYILDAKDLILIVGLVLGFVDLYLYREKAELIKPYPEETFLIRCELESKGEITKCIHKEPYGKLLGFSFGPLSEAYIFVISSKRKK